MKRDLALRCSNPRLICAVYFGLLSVVGTILINALLTSMGIAEEIPVFKAILLGVIVAAGTGALMGERILHSHKPYQLKTFFLGFAMVIFSLPLFNLGLVLFMQQEHPGVLFTGLFSLKKLPQIFSAYLYILGYSYLLFGIALAIAAGVASMYLRGQLVYDILATYEPRRKTIKLPDSPIEKNKLEHSDNIHLNPKAKSRSKHGINTGIK